ncbi:MAG: SEC-C domain-containing protein [Phycisphaerae bacterium]|nr:SEC-C domain-containing protein [Phycisphaerae bacterium]
MIGLVKKLFIKSLGGTRNERIIRTRMKVVTERINPFEEQIRALGDDQLIAKSQELKKRLAAGESRNAILPEAFALVREASRRGRDHRQYDVQLVAGMILDESWIAEEATGEGKTIACYPAIYMAWLEDMHTHVVTVNDYLVQRDAEFAQPIFALLGMTVGFITSNMDSEERQGQYACNITYGTNSEFGFDYLRDNMKLSVNEQVQKSLDFAIVDEVDNILIDEARTPLIISGGSQGETARYKKADSVARELISRNRPWDTKNRQVESLKRELKALDGELVKAGKDEDPKAIQEKLDKTASQLNEAENVLAAETKYFEVELDKKSAHMTHEGVGAAQDIAGVGSFYVGGNMDWPHLMDQSLRAHLVYERDKDYVVQGGAVVIVDEFTGRLLEGRQWSDGLHQAVEAKERVQIKEETQTLATITLQNYFKLYKKLAGMTGTAMTEANEFLKIYKLDVAAVPTNLPIVRADHHDRIYADVESKFAAIVEEVREVSMAGRPVLVGTTSIEKSELLSNMLTRTYGVKHEVLNGRAENAAREAEIVDKAGHQHPLKPGSKEMVGNVTIATNMAGRGTDIKLGEGVVEAGGLHIIGTERHESRRIDNQLRGRSGRQGDPGSSRFFLSLRDDLMAIFAGEWTLKVLGWLGLQGDMAIEDKRISKGIERAQKKVEERNYEIRKNLLEYDEVMDHQRHVFYGMRQDVLEGRNLQEMVKDMLELALDEGIDNYLDGRYAQRCIGEWARQNLQAPIRDEQIKATDPEDLPELEENLRDRTKNEAYQTINLTLIEYVDEGLDQREWDLKGLSGWAMSRFGVQMSQNQLRKMTPADIEEQLGQAAAEQVDKINLSHIVTMLEKNYALEALAEWARAKFGIEITVEELVGDSEDLSDRQETARKILGEKVQAVYDRRQIEYPPEYAVDMTIAQAGTENVYALESLVNWANRKYDAGFTVEQWQGKKPSAILAELVEQSEQWFNGGRLEEYIRKQLGSEPDFEAAKTLAKERFDTNLLGNSEDFDGDVVELVAKAGRQFLRREMTELERFVLLQICDSSWKDHLLSMDHLKGSIGLRGFAEQDPKVAYKREGGKLFDDMFAGIREKVTDMIFKVRLTAGAQMQDVYQVSDQIHEQLQGYDHLARDMADQQEAAEPQKVEQIVREDVKVGRNDPCPCGSGKKYKKCCGQNA